MLIFVTLQNCVKWQKDSCPYVHNTQKSPSRFPHPAQRQNDKLQFGSEGRQRLYAIGPARFDTVQKIVD